MPMVMEEITGQKKSYPETAKVASNGMLVNVPKDPATAARLMTVPKYLDLARRMIGKFTPSNHRSAMLADEDAIDFVAHEIMKGDWDYDGRTKLNTYRGVRAKLGIAEYIKKMSKPQKLDILSLNGFADDCEMQGLLPDPNECDPLSTLIDDEEREEQRRYFGAMLAILTEPQRQCVTMYYVEDMDYHEIAKKLGITRQGVHQNIKRAMGIMKEAAGARP